MKTPQTTELLANFIIGALAQMQNESGEKIIEFSQDSIDILASERNSKTFEQDSDDENAKDLKQSAYYNPKFAKLTPYGKEILKLLMPNILSYAVTKAIYPNGKITFDSENGAIVSSESLRNASLAQAGVYTTGDTNTDAKDLYKNVIRNLEDKRFIQQAGYEFANALKNTSINKCSYEGIKFANEFVKQARAGLNWRFDAAKDISDLMASSNGMRRMESAIDDMVEFWGTFVKNAREFGREVRAYKEKIGGSILITDSRRTGNEAQEAIMQELSDIPTYSYLWDKDMGQNPYLGYLGCADDLIVTGDSVSMCCEACGTGKQVQIYSGSGWLDAKHRRFLNKLFSYT